MNCCCFSWRRIHPLPSTSPSPPVIPIENKYTPETDTRIIPSKITPNHNRGLSTMYIKDGKVVISHSGVDEGKSVISVTVEPAT